MRISLFQYRNIIDILLYLNKKSSYIFIFYFNLIMIIMNILQSFLINYPFNFYGDNTTEKTVYSKIKFI